MEIEKGINPNCSELVVRLRPWRNNVELRAILHELEKATNWNAGVSEHFVDIGEKTYHVAVPVPIEKVKAGKVSDMDNCPYVELGDVFEQGDEPKRISERVGEKLRYGIGELGKLLANGLWCKHQKEPVPKRREPVGLIPYSEPKVEKPVRGKPEKTTMEIRVHDGDGYDDHPALMAFQHCYTPHFEPLARAVKAFRTTWHVHDGGSPDPFRSWCRKNGFGDVATKSHCQVFSTES